MRSRSWALQVLYLWEAQGEVRPLTDVLEAVMRTRRVGASRVERIANHLAVIDWNRSHIDDLIRDAAENWRLERLSRIDRNILRLAVAEMLYLEDVPPKVSIQEAIRLAGQYGGHDSPGFVNGVLDAVLRTGMPSPGPVSAD